MEELLNKLIEKGWKPFGIYGNGELEGERICIEEQTDNTNEYHNKVYYINVDYVEFNGLCDEDKNFSNKFSLRDLVSKSSGLWQFVCENKMIPYDEDGYTWYERTKDYIDDFENTGEMLDLQIDNGYEYRLIESALCDEDKLEQFLLNNIKIDE